ncbi:MAG: hypothetical protein K9L98_01635 [Candidatus Pacebacteria bacterium]|nr:hypothetical protein [Candidatus Paceibacterota bacterium]MCF7862691.1 hypothetical protein [Candidatus Paceibacterota bacterium]
MSSIEYATTEKIFSSKELANLANLEEKLELLLRQKKEKLHIVELIKKELLEVRQLAKEKNIENVSEAVGPDVVESIMDHYDTGDSEGDYFRNILKEEPPVTQDSNDQILDIKKTGSQERQKKKEVIRLPWQKARKKFMTTVKYLILAGSIYFASGAITKNGNDGITWNNKILSSEVFAFENNNQLALPEMTSASKIMGEKDLKFYTDQIDAPSPSIYSIEIRESEDRLPIENLTADSFKKSKREECFGYVCDGLVAAGISREELMLWGDAWSYERNALDAGAEKIYSIYDLHQSNIETFNKKQVKKYFEEKCIEDYTKKIYSIETFKHGDILSLYFSGSSYFNLAYKEGGGKMHTHAGIVIEENGQKYVVHTIGENRRKDKLEDILQGKTLEGRHHFGLAEIIRPDYELSARKKVELDFPVHDISEFVDDTYNRGNIVSLQSETGYKLLKCLKNNRETIKNMFNFSTEETNNILSLSVAIFGNESTFGDGEEYKNEAAEEKEVSTIFQFVRNMGDILGYDDISRGIGQIKEEKTLQEHQNIFSNMDQYSVQYAASASPFILGSIYKHLKGFCENNDIKINNEDMLNVVACVYNKGWDSNSYTKPVKERLLEYRDGKFSLQEYNKFYYIVKIKSFLRNIKFNFYK